LPNELLLLLLLLPALFLEISMLPVVLYLPGLPPPTDDLGAFCCICSCSQPLAFLVLPWASVHDVVRPL
jgi:hypothetical protein